MAARLTGQASASPGRTFRWSERLSRAPRPTAFHCGIQTSCARRPSTCLSGESSRPLLVSDLVAVDLQSPTRIEYARSRPSARGYQWVGPHRQHGTPRLWHLVAHVPFAPVFRQAVPHQAGPVQERQPEETSLLKLSVPILDRISAHPDGQQQGNLNTVFGPVFSTILRGPTDPVSRSGVAGRRQDLIFRDSRFPSRTQNRGPEDPFLHATPPPSKNSTWHRRHPTPCVLSAYCSTRPEPVLYCASQSCSKTESAPGGVSQKHTSSFLICEQRRIHVQLIRGGYALHGCVPPRRLHCSAKQWYADCL